MSRLKEVLGIPYPIIQAPMNWATNAPFVASVSNAGALGVLGPNAGAATVTNELEVVLARLREQIRLTKELTPFPFAVNFPIGRGPNRQISDHCVQIGIEEKIPIAIVSMGSPEVYTKVLQSHGIKVIHAVASLKQARKAEQTGVDAVICQGTEAGGHIGETEISNLVLIPELVESVNIPVIAAGAIVDARGLLSTLVLGADGICMGTRFLATIESPVHERIKTAILNADENSTVVWGRGWSIARGLKNRFTEEVQRREIKGVAPTDLQEYVNSYQENANDVNRRIGGLIHGDLENGEIYLGEGAARIKQILTVNEVVQELMEGAKRTLEEFNKKYNF